MINKNFFYLNYIHNSKEMLYTIVKKNSQSWELSAMFNLYTNNFGNKFEIKVYLKSTVLRSSNQHNISYSEAGAGSSGTSNPEAVFRRLLGVLPYVIRFKDMPRDWSILTWWS